MNLLEEMRAIEEEASSLLKDDIHASADINTLTKSWFNSYFHEVFESDSLGNPDAFKGRHPFYDRCLAIHKKISEIENDEAEQALLIDYLSEVIESKGSTFFYAQVYAQRMEAWKYIATRAAESLFLDSPNAAYIYKSTLYLTKALLACSLWLAEQGPVKYNVFFLWRGLKVAQPSGWDLQQWFDDLRVNALPTVGSMSIAEVKAIITHEDFLGSFINSYQHTIPQDVSCLIVATNNTCYLLNTKYLDSYPEDVRAWILQRPAVLDALKFLKSEDEE